MTCPHCGSGNIIQKTVICQQNEVGLIGLRYKRAKVFYGAEQIYADLCTDCGTLVRQYVERTDRTWEQKSAD